MASGELPEGWAEWPFDECVLAPTERHSSVQQNAYASAGRYPVVDQGEGLIAGYTDDASLVYTKELPLILFGDHTRHFKYLDFPFATGADGTKLFRARSDKLEPKYFYYALRALDLPSRGYNRHFKYLREQTILAPQEKREQHSIAAVLSMLQGAVEAQDKIVATLMELKAATLAKLFREGLRGEPLKETEIGEIPESWEVVLCESLCEVITVGIVVTPAKYYVPSGVPCLRSFNIREDRLYEEDLVFISSEANRLHSKSILREGDVVIVRTGYPGTACVVPAKYHGANCIDMLIARPKSTILSDFLARYLNSPRGKSQVSVGKGGLAQQHFNVGALRTLKVARPPVEEQAEISRLGSSFDQRIQEAEGVRYAAAGLFSSMLHLLMTGEVRVNNASHESILCPPNRPGGGE